MNDKVVWIYLLEFIPLALQIFFLFGAGDSDVDVLLSLLGRFLEAKLTRDVFDRVKSLALFRGSDALDVFVIGPVA